MRTSSYPSGVGNKSESHDARTKKLQTGKGSLEGQEMKGRKATAGISRALGGRRKAGGEKEKRTETELKWGNVGQR